MKLVLIDDHPLVRKGLISVLGSESTIEIIGEAETVEESLRVINQRGPDLVLIDLRLGQSSGLEVIEKVRLLKLDIQFIILTSSGSEQDFLRAKQLGVNGYLLKEALPEEIINAIKIVSQGRKYYDPGVMEITMKKETTSAGELTQREQEVLSALGKGLSNREIASRLYVSENTVKKHVSQILSKLDLDDRTQAALFAYSKGLVRDVIL